MRNRSTIIFFILLASCLTFISCAGKPMGEFTTAREAIQAAKTAGAERYAAEPLTDAQSSFNEAEAGAATRDELRELYVRAAIQAKIAQAQAQMKETEETLRQVRADHAKAKEAATAAKNSADEAARAVGLPIP